MPRQASAAWIGAVAASALLALIGILAPLAMLLLVALLAAWRPMRHERAALAVALGTHHWLILLSLLLVGPLEEIGDEVLERPTLLASLWLLNVAVALPVLVGLDVVRDPRAGPRVLLRALPAGALAGWGTMALVILLDRLATAQGAREALAAFALAPVTSFAFAPFAALLGALVGVAFAALDLALVALARRLRRDAPPQRP